MRAMMSNGLRIVVVTAGSAALAACGATSAPPPRVALPAPPSAPKAMVIPPRPLPPTGAVERMTIPALGRDGQRLTVNRGISSMQTLWNLRSGLNVAALNCQRAQHTALVDNYKVLLKRHSRELAKANTALAAEYRKAHGASYRSVQDTYMTRVYNYFALPPTLPQFCDAALAVSGEVVKVAPGGLEQYSLTALPRLEAVFENFFRSYEQYRVDLTAWDSRYGRAGAHGAAAAQPVAQLDARYPVPASKADGGGRNN